MHSVAWRDDENRASLAPHSLPLIVAEPKSLLEFLIVALDPPSPLVGVGQGVATGGVGQGGKKVFRWFGFASGPFDQTPFLGPGRAVLIVTMRRAHPHGGEARGEPGVAAFASGDPPPGVLGQCQRQLPDRDRPMFGIVTDRRGGAATPAPGLGRQWSVPEGHKLMVGETPTT